MKRRPANDPEKLKIQKANRKRSKNKMKDVKLGVYIRIDCEKTIKNGSCEFIGVLEKELDDPKTGIKKSMIAKIGVGKDEALHAGFINALTLLSNYEFFEEWDAKREDHRRWIDYAMKNPATREYAEKRKYDMTTAQGKLSFTEAAAQGGVDIPTPDPGPPVKDATKKQESVMVNGVQISGSLETVIRVVRDLVFNG